MYRVFSLGQFYKNANSTPLLESLPLWFDVSRYILGENDSIIFLPDSQTFRSPPKNP